MVIVSTLEVIVGAWFIRVRVRTSRNRLSTVDSCAPAARKKKMKPFVRELGSTLELEADLRRSGKLQYLIFELV